MIAYKRFLELIEHYLYESIQLESRKEDGNGSDRKASIKDRPGTAATRSAVIDILHFTLIVHPLFSAILVVEKVCLSHSN